MLRIAKNTPGVLDLSAVHDEHGIPVTLIGPSHRDVPDNEENNPVLQRVVELRWVTMTRLSVTSSDDTAETINTTQSPDVLPEDEKIANATTNEIDSGQTTTDVEPPIEPPVQPTVEPHPAPKPDRRSSRRT